MRQTLDSIYGGVRIQSTDGSKYSSLDQTNSGNLRLYKDEVGVSRWDVNGALLHGTSTAGSAGSGDIVVNGSVYLGGSAAANALDDYEEGTWTPVVKLGTNTQTIGGVVGKYTKIGNSVTVNMRWYVSVALSGNGNLSIEGLPFTSGSEANNYIAAPVVTDRFVTVDGAIALHLNPSSTIFLAYQHSSGDAYADSPRRVNDTDFDGCHVHQMKATFTYIT